MSRRITKEAIVDAAMSIGDDKGLEAISMRSVAAALGIQAMSLYHHIANKAELLDALHERLILEIEMPSASSGWKELLRRSARAYRAVALAHPRLFILLATRPMSTPAAFAHIAPALKAIDEEEIPPSVQLFILETLFTSLNGYLLAEVAPVPGHPELVNPSMGSAADQGADMLSLLARMDASGEGVFYFDRHFDRYVDVLITGFAALVEEG